MPIIRGMRMSVEHVILMFARGISNEAVMKEYPFAEPDNIRACLPVAAQRICTDIEMIA